MEVNDAIVRSIVEVCGEKNLNATNFVKNGNRITWQSNLGDLGNVVYYVPFSEFKKNLENGMRIVSILIAFADLITQSENKGMIDNIKIAAKRGAPSYFTMSSPDSNIVRMYVPKATNAWEFATIPIKFTKMGDGEYEWSIPESAELYSSIYSETSGEPGEPMGLGDSLRGLSNYTGLERGASAGVPVLYATQSVRDYSSGYTQESLSNDLDITE